LRLSHGEHSREFILCVAKRFAQASYHNAKNAQRYDQSLPYRSSTPDLAAVGSVLMPATNIVASTNGALIQETIALWHGTHTSIESLTLCGSTGIASNQCE
jgi:hypothetical protein